MRRANPGVSWPGERWVIGLWAQGAWAVGAARPADSSQVCRMLETWKKMAPKWTKKTVKSILVILPKAD